MSRPQDGMEQTRRAKAWRALGYDGVSLITIPVAVLSYWRSGDGDGSLIKGLGVLLILVMAWLFARQRRHSQE